MQIILGSVSSFIMVSIAGWGYLGVFLIMVVESSNIPIPSEITMTFAGYLTSLGKFNFELIILVGALGNLGGSLFSYLLGRHLGRPGVLKYGKYFLVHQKELDRAQKWFDKFGIGSVFLTRMLPIVRTFISFPAGIAKMNIGLFSVYTFAGCYVWCTLLVLLGRKFGQHWQDILQYFRRLDYLVLMFIGIGIVYVINKLIKRHKKRIEAAKKLNKEQ